MVVTDGGRMQRKLSNSIFIYYSKCIELYIVLSTIQCQAHDKFRNGDETFKWGLK